MAGQVLKGAVMGLKIGSQGLDCEVDASLSIDVSTTDIDPCKPSATEAYKSSTWADPEVDVKSWTLTGSAKAFTDAVGFSNTTLVDLLINGSPIVEVQFYTKEHTDYDYKNILVFTGSGILSLDSWDAPSTGESTYSFTITGKGKPTFTKTPVTP